jgi:aminoglycoside phosphotransferase (APT) family kinase protein
MTVRLPHRLLAAQLLLSEQRWLPIIGPSLPLPVPIPIRVGRPTPYFPWAWSVLPWFAGAPIGPSADLDGAQAAQHMGHFLAALHRPAPDSAPVNTSRGVPLADRHQMTMDRIDGLEDRAERAKLRTRWRRYVELPHWNGPPMWLHADLHPMNVLQHQGLISAVIDFGDITSGDPATDLAIAYSILEPEHRPALRQAADSPTRPIDDAMWLRAEGWAMSVGLAIIMSSADSPPMYQVGLRMIGS